MTAPTASVVDEVVDLLRQLRLPHMRRHAPDVLATAKAQRWEPAEAIRALLAEELAGRQASSVGTRRKAAGFPTGKTFDAGDEATSSIPAPTQRSLRTLEWIGAHENLVVCGPSGTGKSHLLEALGHAAVDAGAHVLWFSLQSLGALFRRHRADDTTARALRKLMRADLICIHDIGLLPVTTETAEALYRVVDAASERRAIALSSNLHPAGFGELMPKTINNATVDRLLHHAPPSATPWRPDSMNWRFQFDTDCSDTFALRAASATFISPASTDNTSWDFSSGDNALGRAIRNLLVRSNYDLSHIS